jgi:predicted small metal-binding protein
MKTLTCKQLGATDCDHAVTGATTDEVKQKMFMHAQTAHPEKFIAMTPEQMKMAEEMMNNLLSAQA